MEEQREIQRKYMVSAIDDGSELKCGLTLWDRVMKRAADVSLSGLLLIGLSPLYLGCYIAVRREDGGQAIYSQERIGLHGKPFRIFKFRSMKPDSELEGPQLFDKDDDPRLTKIGKWLREHHLDELPQIWNVFIGDMSFIGPRPERKYYIDKIMERDARYKYLYQIRPGITSFATLYNGYTDTIEKMLIRLRYDLYYLQHASLLHDMKILWRTFVGIVKGKKL